MVRKMKSLPGQRMLDSLGNMMVRNYKNGQKRYTFNKR